MKSSLITNSFKHLGGTGLFLIVKEQLTIPSRSKKNAFFFYLVDSHFV